MAVTASIFLSPMFKCVIEVFSLAQKVIFKNKIPTFEYMGL